MAAQLWHSLRGSRRRSSAGARTAEPATGGLRTDERRTRKSHPNDVRVAGRGRPMMLEERPARWRLRRHNPLAAVVWFGALAATLVLILGILLTWSNANIGNPIVDAVIWAGAWLATPFRSMFTDPNPDRQLMMNWSIAAAVYLIGGRLLAWLLRW
jgi:hypothetical protein